MSASAKRLASKKRSRTVAVHGRNGVDDVLPSSPPGGNQHDGKMHVLFATTATELADDSAVVEAMCGDNDGALPDLEACLKFWHAATSTASSEHLAAQGVKKQSKACDDACSASTFTSRAIGAGAAKPADQAGTISTSLRIGR